jgi:outer membrane protein TolC
VQRSYAAYLETRNSYIPQVVAGSGLGWTYGYPLSIEGSPPALLNVVTQSTLLNFAQNQFMKAARIDWRASELQSKDQRAAVIQDVALTYAELAKWEARLVHLQEDESQARKTETAVSERFKAGVDSETDLNRAKLTTARVRLHRAEARGSADVLRRHLSTLTGIVAAAIEIDAATIPSLPVVDTADDLPDKVAGASPSVRVAEQRSSAAKARAEGEHRALLPSLDFSAQYARFSSFNNYTEYFPPHTFQVNNATIGAGIRFPIFNATQRARAEGADADALKAAKQAEAVRDQVTEETLKLQRTAEQLEAARDVAQLEYQLAQSSLEAARTKVEANTGTLHELSDAQTQAAEHFLLFQDADFEYQRARLNLLKATGDLEKWVTGTPDDPSQHLQ